MVIASDSSIAASSSTATATATAIVPIRVDALSEDKTIRIVDTLLFDPTCWPISLYQPLHAAIEQNVSLLAHTILSDAEVQGMGRTVRHFTGRLDLLSPILLKKIEDQLRPQLWKIATNTSISRATPKNSTGDSSSSVSHLMPISIRLMIDKIVVHEDILWDQHGPLSPFEFAKDMAEEMNLPEEATVAIATTIVEQLHGLEVDTTPDQTLTINTTSIANNGQSQNQNKTPNVNSTGSSHGTATSTPTTLASGTKKPRGAWLLDTKEQTSIVSQVVAQHRSI